MMDFTELASLACDPVSLLTDRLRLAVAAYLGRFTGSSREHTESDLRCYLAWCAERDLDPLAAQRPHLELYIRWMQEIRRFKPSTVSRRLSVAAGFYRTCVLDGVLEHSPAEHVRRPVPAESPTLGFTHLQFEALLTAARESPNPCDFALVAMLGLLGLRIFEATSADIAHLGEEHGHRVLRVCGKGTKVVLVPLPPAVGRASSYTSMAAGGRSAIWTAAIVSPAPWPTAWTQPWCRSITGSPRNTPFRPHSTTAPRSSGPSARPIRASSSPWPVIAPAGNLAAAIAAEGRIDEDLRVDAQLLVYPALDPRQQHASHTQFADGYLLTRSDMAFYWNNYLPAPADRSDPRAAPATIADFAGLPPAVIVTAGFDPLHDEGREYAQRLIAANVRTVYLPFPGLTHGFLDMASRVPAAQQAADTAVRSLNLLLPGPRALALAVGQAEGDHHEERNARRTAS